MQNQSNIPICSCHIGCKSCINIKFCPSSQNCTVQHQNDQKCKYHGNPDYRDILVRTDYRVTCYCNNSECELQGCLCRIQLEQPPVQ